MAWSKGFSKFLKVFFCKQFLLTGFCDTKNKIFANLQIFFAESKCRAQELSNDVSFVIFGHQTWHILVFKYPSRDRVNNLDFLLSTLKVVIMIIDFGCGKKNNTIMDSAYKADYHFQNLILFGKMLVLGFLSISLMKFRLCLFFTQA